jgi:hypothetical protein
MTRSDIGTPAGHDFRPHSKVGRKLNLYAHATGASGRES